MLYQNISCCNVLTLFMTICVSAVHPDDFVTGVVSSVKESYGFLQILSPDCSTGMGDAQLFFHFNELYENITTPVVVGDEIEFTVRDHCAFVYGLPWVIAYTFDKPPGISVTDPVTH